MVATGLPTLGRAQSLPELDAYPAYNVLDMYFSYGGGVKLLDKAPFHTHGNIITASWTNGLHHRCLDFNPDTPDYVEIPATATQLDFTSEDFSIVIRVYIDTVAIRQLFVRGFDNIDGYKLFIYAGGRINFRTFQLDANQQTRSDDGEIVVGNWYTIGVSRSGELVTLYKNGSNVNFVEGTHLNPTTCSRTTKIGVDDDLVGTSFDGKIEFLRIFKGIALPATAHAWFHSVLK